MAKPKSKKSQKITINTKYAEISIEGPLLASNEVRPSQKLGDYYTVSVDNKNEGEVAMSGRKKEVFTLMIPFNPQQLLDDVQNELEDMKDETLGNLTIKAKINRHLKDLANAKGLILEQPVSSSR